MYKGPEHYLDSDASTSRIMAHARLLQKLSRRFEAIAPSGLRHAARVANYKSGKIVIHADNGAVAVKLRQMAPSLTREFSSRGIECTGVTVKVQALDISHQSRTPVGRALPAGACQNLGQLAEGMPASPLRDAIEQLLERSLREE